MAYIVIVINTGESTYQLNGRAVIAANNAREGTQLVEKVVQSVLSRDLPGSVQVTTRTTDPAVAVVGDGGAQVTYNIG